MIEHDEPWQVYAKNGLPVPGMSATRNEFGSNTDLGMGGSQVWIWRHGDAGTEILLQKRATTKSTWPSHFSASAEGHIDANESPVAAAVREAREELGIELDQEKLLFIFSLRTPLDIREIASVYLYELRADNVFTFDDGEVDSVQWVALDNFRKYIEDPNEYNLVPQGTDYFSLLLSHLVRVSQ